MPKELTTATVRTLLPSRPPDAHKGTFGHVFIIAGSMGFVGAAKLAAVAAGRSGVGLVTVGVPDSIIVPVSVGLLEAMSLPLPSTAHGTIASAATPPALEFASTKQAVALGPGLGQQAETRGFVLDFLRRCEKPVVLDADGLNSLAHDPSALNGMNRPVVLTPHPGEMARLLRCSVKEVQADRNGVAARFAAEHRCVVVLKGKGTIIADPAGGLYRNTTGNSGMATGGAGDVLTGLIGGLLAQGLPALEAALVGVYVHGLAGDLAADAFTGRGMIAGDVVNTLPAAWQSIERGA